MMKDGSVANIREKDFSTEERRGKEYDYDETRASLYSRNERLCFVMRATWEGRDERLQYAAERYH